MTNEAPGKPMTEHGGTPDVVALRTAYAARSMCRTLAWLVSMALCVVLVGTIMPWWAGYGDMVDNAGFSSVTDAALALGPWLGMIVFMPAYSLWNSRLMTCIISFYEGRVMSGANTLLERFWLGILFLSGPAWPSALPHVAGGRILYDLSWPQVAFGIMSLLLLSVPVISACLGGMQRGSSRRPVRQTVPVGFALMIGTALFYFLGGFLFSYCQSSILWAFGGT